MGVEMLNEKFKILSSESQYYNHVDIRDMMIALLDQSDYQRYLDRLLCLHPQERARVEFGNRRKHSWMKYQEHRK